jgi:cytochrome d ubiquinol oxidase subunit I
MHLDPLLLSRLQFAWVIAFHILLPAFTVGTASYVALNEGLHFFTSRDIYLRISAFWTKIFAISFGMGVVSGVIMPFQFGTNWSRFSDATANILSPLLAYEGLTAFFLEAAFLGVLLFGRNRVPRWAHFVAAMMVAAGTLFSSFWILATNSWATGSSTAASSRWTGQRSSSTRLFRIGSRIRSPASTSPPASWWSRSPPT